MLEKVRDAAKLNLTGKNLEVFLTEIAVAFHGFVHISSKAVDLVNTAKIPTRTSPKVPCQCNWRFDVG
jgi:hypothetical protein